MQQSLILPAMWVNFSKRKLTESANNFQVDLVLGMPEATGALRLVWLQSTSSKKWTSTTLVALLYLVFSTLGRLSVASIGLAFNVNENVTTILPIGLTDWNSSEWFDLKRVDVVGSESDYYNGYFKKAMCEYIYDQQIISFHS